MKRHYDYKHRFLLNCLNCNKRFYSNYTLRKYCSSKCNIEAFSKNKEKFGKLRTGMNINCKQCNKSFYICKHQIGKKFYCSMKCYSIAQRQTKSNEKSPNWKGGRSRWRLREARRILLENNHNLTICELCGSKKIINIHHRNWQPNDNRINNLQVLCMSCHIKAHSKLINQILQLPTVQEFLKTLS